MTMSLSERQSVRAIRRLMPRLKKADIVMAHLPTGEEVLVKGRDALDSIIASNRPRLMHRVHVDVVSIDMAAGLEQVLGGDGFYSGQAAAGHA